MKLSKLFCTVLLAGALAVFGCGNDGGGGQSASEVCDECENQSDRGLCETAYNQCRNLPNLDECIAGSLGLCSAL